MTSVLNLFEKPSFKDDPGQALQLSQSRLAQHKSGYLGDAET